MKNLILYITILTLGFTSCNQDDYFLDSGVHDPVFDGTAMDYLDANAKRPIDLYDTVVQVIRYAGLENTLKNDDITFFAVADPSINKLITNLNNQLYFMGQDTITSFKQVKPDVWKYFLSQYIVKGKLGIIDIPQVDTLKLYDFEGQLFQTYNSEAPLNIGVNYKDMQNSGVTIPYQGSREIIISHIPDFSQPKRNWLNAKVNSSGHIVDNGIVHGVNYVAHVLGFRSSRFISLAQEMGIDYDNN